PVRHGDRDRPGVQVLGDQTVTRLHVDAVAGRRVAERADDRQGDAATLVELVVRAARAQRDRVAGRLLAAVTVAHGLLVARLDNAVVADRDAKRHRAPASAHRSRQLLAVDGEPDVRLSSVGQRLRVRVLDASLADLELTHRGVRDRDGVDAGLDRDRAL